MVKPFTGTLSGLKKVDGQETVARVFSWFSVVNHRMTAFMMVAADAIINHIDKIERISHGEFKCPIIIRAVTADAGPFYSGITHSQDFTNVFREAVSFPVLDPVNGAGVTSCLLAARRSGKPCMIIERKSRY